VPQSELGGGLPDLEEDVRAARQRYHSHPLSFYNIDPASLEFGAGQARGVSGTTIALPTVRLADSSEHDVRHLVPWAVVVASSFGPWGNLGKKKYAGEGVVENALEAAQEVGVASVGLCPGEEENEELVAYTKVRASTLDPTPARAPARRAPARRAASPPPLAVAG
jgi:hypothetical protein